MSKVLGQVGESQEGTHGSTPKDYQIRYIYINKRPYTNCEGDFAGERLNKEEIDRADYEANVMREDREYQMYVCSEQFDKDMEALEREERLEKERQAKKDEV